MRELDELQGTWVSRATGDLTCGLRVCRESRREAHRHPRDPARHHCLFFLTSSRFCRPGILPMSCYHGYTVTRVVRTQRYQSVLVSFRDGRRVRREEGGEVRYARPFACCCKRVPTTCGGTSDCAAINFHCYALFIICFCVCYFN